MTTETLITIVLVLIVGWAMLSDLLLVELCRQSQRSRGLRVFAAEHGFTYAKHDRLPHKIRLLLEREHTIPEGWQLVRVRNVMRGRHAGAEVLVFDCQYTKTGHMTAKPLFATIACLRRDQTHSWTFVSEPRTGGTQYLDVGSMLTFMNDAAAEFARAATA